jgi:tRNA1(Val) A37 N6-methylase TrmN6
LNEPEAIRIVAGEATSQDDFLGGRISLLQPAKGYRAAIDPVFLAAAVAAAPGQRVLDVGTGVGTAALCLAARIAGLHVVGVDRQRDLVGLARRNAEINGLGDRIDVMVGDLKQPPVRLAAGTFDHVLANPPFLDSGRGNRPPDAGKAAATVEDETTLEDWLRFCLLMVRPKCSVTLIHRADRLDQVLAALGGRLGDIVIFPLWPGPATAPGLGEKPAKRVIIRGRKGVAAPLRLAPGLVLHAEGGAFTPGAEAVLRHGAGLIL